MENRWFDPFEAEVYVDNPKSVFHISMTSPIHTGKVSGMRPGWQIAFAPRLGVK